MFEYEKETLKEEAADAVLEIGFEMLFEVVGEVLFSVFDGI